MPSSTSSSERQSALRALFAMLAVLSCSILGARLVLALPPPLAEDRTDARFAMIVDALPTIRAEHGRRLVLTLGSSMVVDGFSPLDFDARAAERGLATTSFNLGCTGSIPELLRLLAARTATVLEARGEKAAAIYVELPPHLATRKATARDLMSNELRRPPLTGMGDHLRTARRWPEFTSRQLGLWLLGWHRPGELTTKIEIWLFPSAGDPSAEARKKMMTVPAGKRLRERVVREPPWDASQRGESRRPIEQDEIELVLEMARRKGVDNERRILTGTYDGADLDLDPTAVEDTIAAVRELRRVADDVYVLVMPRSTRYLPSALGRARLAAVLERLRGDGVAVADFFDTGSFEADDFNGLVHLNGAKGRTKLSTAMADHFADARRR